MANKGIIGRPKLSKRRKKINYGFTALPQLETKLNKIRGSKSSFMAAIMQAVPESYIQDYNSDSESFLSIANKSVLVFHKEAKSV